MFVKKTTNHLPIGKKQFNGYFFLFYSMIVVLFPDKKRYKREGHDWQGPEIF
jgi:hypothetical protein